ncbi:MAG TPA: hypothetical protein VLX31_13755 [Streptosporangiaceae bacterium]|nr:hypothetical protein [Streptosporangiaceae bacterium]
MIAVAALCPAPPLLVPELTGAEAALPDVREACLAAAGELTAAEPDAVAVLGTGGQARRWDPGSGLNLAAFTAGRRPRPAVGEPNLPAALGVGAWLLTAAGYRGTRVLQSVGSDEPAAACAGVGAALAAAPGRLALLVMADGSARRTLRAPGYLDPRAEAFDAATERAVRSGRLDALLAVDRALAAELMAHGVPALQAMAGALAGRQVRAQIRYCGAPLGVGYLVASLRVGGAGLP